jgi:peptide/nickel transport system ATP-binding protein
MSLLEVRDLEVGFAVRHAVVRPVAGASLSLAPGEILGVVGESGAGKSMLGAAIIGLLPAPCRMTGGEVRLDGARIDTLPPHAMRRLRGRRIGFVMQDPMASLDPLYTVGRQLMETMRTHLPLSAAEARQRAIFWLDTVGIPGAARRVDSYPHEFSGGQRQRIIVALALCAEPALLIADEPTSALDVSVQAQIVALLHRLTREHGTAVLLISHDIGVIAEVADRVAVMYAGRVVEIGPVAAVIRNPAHPYTAGLMRSIPPLNRRLDVLSQIDGVMPRPDAIPSGCAFHPRCPHAWETCRTSLPLLRRAGETDAACWLHAAPDPAVQPRLQHGSAE